MNPAMSEMETGRVSSRSSEVATLSACGKQLITTKGTLWYWYLNSNKYTIAPTHVAPSIIICFLGGFANTVRLSAPTKGQHLYYPGVYLGWGNMRRFDELERRKSIFLQKNIQKKLNFNIFGVLYTGSSCANVMGRNQHHALKWKYCSDHERWTQFPSTGASNH